MKSTPVPSGITQANPRDLSYKLQDLHKVVNEKIETVGSFTSGNIPEFNSEGYVQDSGKVPPVGEIVGTTDTQTLDNKTLTTPTIADFSNAQHDHQDADDAGKLDHGLALDGLGDDDHTQYVLADGSRDIDFSGGDWEVGDVTGGTKVSITSDGTISIDGDIEVLGKLDSAQCSAGATLGLVVGKLPIYKAGVLQGYIPIYDAIL